MQFYLMANLLKKIHNYPPFVVNAIKSAAYSFYKISEKILQPPFDKYDFQTFDLIRKILPDNANCIDVGAHKAYILKKIIEKSPKGKHFAFEPIPWLYKDLQKKYGKKASIFDIAVSNERGESDFNVFGDRPAVSGLKKREFTEDYKLEKIRVKVDTLDNIIPDDVPIQLIKIDVEGAELQVLQGAVNILKRNKPLVIFEFGLGGADIYGTTPESVFDFFENLGLSISILEYYLKNKEPFNREEFIGQYEKGYNYFFIVYNHV